MSESVAEVFCSCGHPNWEHHYFKSYSDFGESCNKCTCARFTNTYQIRNVQTTKSLGDYNQAIQLLKQAYNTISLHKEYLDGYNLQKWLDETLDLIGRS